MTSRKLCGRLAGLVVGRSTSSESDRCSCSGRTTTGFRFDLPRDERPPSSSSSSSSEIPFFEGLDERDDSSIRDDPVDRDEPVCAWMVVVDDELFFPNSLFRSRSSDVVGRLRLISSSRKSFGIGAPMPNLKTGIFLSAKSLPL